MEVLVTGATGFVGSRLVPALQQAGHNVTALVRDPSQYHPPEDVTVVEGDLLEPDTLAGTFAGIDVVYYLVHSMQAGEDFAERDRRAAQTVVDATAGTTVDRMVYLGGLGEAGSELSSHLASRREVESILGTGKYALTTLRAAIIIGAGSVSFDMVYQLASRLPVMITPRWVDTKCQPIAITDVIAYLVELLDAPETAGKTYEIGGPEVLTYREMLERTAKIMDRNLWILPVPVLTPRLSAYWVDLVTNVPKSVAYPLIDGLKNPVVVTDDRIRDHVHPDLTPFEDAVARAIETMEGE